MVKTKGSRTTDLLWAPGEHSSVPGTSPALSPCSDDSRPSWLCACPQVPGRTEKNQSFIWIQKIQCNMWKSPLENQQKIFVLVIKTESNLLNKKQLQHKLKIEKNQTQTLEALDWLRRSFCSKILEYFFRSFLIFCSRTEIKFTVLSVEWNEKVSSSHEPCDSDVKMFCLRSSFKRCQFEDYKDKETQISGQVLE